MERAELRDARQWAETLGSGLLFGESVSLGYIQTKRVTGGRFSMGCKHACNCLFARLTDPSLTGIDARCPACLRTVDAAVLTRSPMDLEDMTDIKDGQKKVRRAHSNSLSQIWGQNDSHKGSGHRWGTVDILRVSARIAACGTSVAPKILRGRALALYRVSQTSRSVRELSQL